MAVSNSILWVSAKPPISNIFLQNPKHLLPQISPQPLRFQSSTIHCGLRELRVRIDSIKNTQKITEAMKLVAAARVRRAQEARLQCEDIDVPLTNVRPVKKVAIVVITADRGLCGGFNNLVVKKAEARIAELKKLGLDITLISVGKKGNSYFMRRPEICVDKFIEGGLFATTKEAQVIADDVFSLFVSEEVDKVELVYNKFVSLVKSEPVIHTLLPLSPKGEVVDVTGNSVDAIEDEFFRLTTKEGKLSVERESVKIKREGLLPVMEFEQDPVQILDAMMPLYLNTSELAARMNAMSNATDNAVDLTKTLSNVYNRQRQAKITGEILEIVAGAEALKEFE
ncbi:ATP synthase gamma chain [Pyrus ussuriensis x Pyrus communis]|uniref:F-ATPase gamma subunit n=1 Tax=Pyrus ussuriensis x Pyrus communis TaxID=2448454 RepID=A0A5N5I5M7_9ROSA|nr:ATP synthase gamma chain [Pyrus ussuriensis x Pyrus communis]